jgi:hypothetical protein
MELDELKTAWAAFDKNVTQSLKLNEKLVRKISLENSKRKLNKPVHVFMVKIVVITFCLIFFLLDSTFKLSDSFPFQLIGFLILLISLAYVILNVLKINRYLRIDYMNSSIVSLQVELTSLKVWILKVRKLELILLVPFMMSLLVIMFKIVGIDIIHHIQLYMLELAIVFSLVIPLFLWVNKHLYKRQLEEAHHYLNDLEVFRSEDEPSVSAL